jgi:hypothetical protein
MHNVYDDPAHEEIRWELHAKLQDMRAQHDDRSGEE